MAKYIVLGFFLLYGLYGYCDTPKDSVELRQKEIQKIIKKLSKNTLTDSNYKKYAKFLKNTNAMQAPTASSSPARPKND